MRVQCLVVRVVLVLMLFAQVASADVVWRAPAGCPDTRDAQTRIELRVAAGREIRGIEVAVVREGTTFVARITTPTQERTLTSARCDELADAVAVIVARLASERQVAPTPVLRTEVPVVAMLAARPPAHRARSYREWGFAGRATALSGIGMVPRIGVGGELSLLARRRKLFTEVGVARWSSRSDYLVDGVPGSADIGIDLVAVRAGWAPPDMPLRVWFGGELGTMHATDTARRWTAITSGLAVGWPMIEQARLVGMFELAVPTSRVDLMVPETGNLHSSSALAARCSLGLEVGLP